MKIKIKKGTVNYTEEEYDVNFPIYREDCCFNHTKLTRIDKDLIAVSITRGESEDEGITEFNLEFERDYKFEDGQIDFMLGRGIYKSSEEEFYKIIDQARSHIDTIINQKNNK